jgi:DNA-binding MarR family transcriptional regulator
MNRPVATSMGNLRDGRDAFPAPFAGEKQGLVETKHDLLPKNLVRVVVTANGEEAFQRQRSANAVTNLTSRLTKEEREPLGSSADKLRFSAAELIRQMMPSPCD